MSAISVVPFKVAWRHCDPAGLLHYGNIFRFLEDAELNLLSKIGFSYVEMEKRGFAFPRIHVEYHFSNPLLFEDEGYVICKLGKIGNTSVEFLFFVYKQIKGDSKYIKSGKGQFVCVTIDIKKRSSIPIPNDFRTALLEGGKNDVESIFKSDQGFGITSDMPEPLASYLLQELGE